MVSTKYCATECLLLVMTAALQLATIFHFRFARLDSAEHSLVMLTGCKRLPVSRVGCVFLTSPPLARGHLCSVWVQLWGHCKHFSSCGRARRSSHYAWCCTWKKSLHNSEASALSISASSCSSGPKENPLEGMWYPALLLLWTGGSGGFPGRINLSLVFACLTSLPCGKMLLLPVFGWLLTLLQPQTSPVNF